MLTQIYTKKLANPLAKPVIFATPNRFGRRKPLFEYRGVTNQRNSRIKSRNLNCQNLWAEKVV